MPLTVDPIWIERLRQAAASPGKPRARRIDHRWDAEYPRAEYPDRPSERWIEEKLKTEWDDLSANEKQTYSAFHWPESMLSGALPWEAVPAALELFAYMNTGNSRGRPSIRDARWFWRVTLAAPDISIGERESCSRGLAQLEARGHTPKDLLFLEAYLAFAPWRSEENKAAHDQYVAQIVAELSEEEGKSHEARE